MLTDFLLLKKANVILALNKVKIIASGNHQKLLISNKQYKEWVRIQRMD